MRSFFEFVDLGQYLRLRIEILRMGEAIIVITWHILSFTELHPTYFINFFNSSTWRSFYKMIVLGYIRIWVTLDRLCICSSSYKLIIGKKAFIFIFLIEWIISFLFFIIITLQIYTLNPIPPIPLEFPWVILFSNLFLFKFIQIWTIRITRMTVLIIDVKTLSFSL